MQTTGSDAGTARMRGTNLALVGLSMMLLCAAVQPAIAQEQCAESGLRWTSSPVLVPPTHGSRRPVRSLHDGRLWPAANPWRRGRSSWLGESHTVMAARKPETSTFATITPVAVATSNVHFADFPMALELQYNRARVFNTTIGHDVKALRVPGTAELIRRGTAWAAGILK
jgi:hypothetical protein